MRDEFSGERFPDLPHVGYATRREREASDAIMMFMRGTERDRILLLSIVIDGPDKWRKVAADKWRPYRIDTDTIDAVYRYFVMQAGPNPYLQREELERQQALQARQQRGDFRLHG